MKITYHNFFHKGGLPRFTLDFPASLIALARVFLTTTILMCNTYATTPGCHVVVDKSYQQNRWFAILISPVAIYVTYILDVHSISHSGGTREIPYHFEVAIYTIKSVPRCVGDY